MKIKKITAKIVFAIENNKVLNMILGCPLSFYNKIKHKQYLRNYHKYGLETLKSFVECLDSYNYPYVLFAGTMLGAIREHGFIKHDEDIDTALWIDDFHPELIKHLDDFGFSVDKAYSIDNDNWGKELTFYHRQTKVRIDLLFIYPPVETYPYYCEFLFYPGFQYSQRTPRRKEFPAIKERTLVRFEDKIDVYIPANAVELCKWFYGDDYLIPKQNWDWVSDGKRHTIEWPEMTSYTTFLRRPNNDEMSK